MLGNPELERALLEQTYDGVMTVTGTRKQEVNGETVVTPDAVLHENIPCALSFSGTPDSITGRKQRSDQLSGDDLLCAGLDRSGRLPHCGSAVWRDLSAEIQRRKRGLSDPSAAFRCPRGASVMASWGSCDFHELRDLNERIKAAASEQEMDAFYTGLLDEMMNGLLTDVKELTPVDRGHLRRNWFITKAKRSGKHYRAEIYNNIEYAPWVENGHRQEVGRYVPAIGKRLVNGFVEGRHMLREGLLDFQKEAPDFIKAKSEEFLSRMMEGK